MGIKVKGSRIKAAVTQRIRQSRLIWLYIGIVGMGITGMGIGATGTIAQG